MTRYVGLNLLSGTSVYIETYGGPIEVLVSLMAVIYKYQTYTNSAGCNGYGQP